jgi:hypothetical protein
MAPPPLKPAVTRGERHPGGVRRYRFRHWINQAGLYISVLILVSPSILFFIWMLSLSL